MYGSTEAAAHAVQHYHDSHRNLLKHLQEVDGDGRIMCLETPLTHVLLIISGDGLDGEHTETVITTARQGSRHLRDGDGQEVPKEIKEQLESLGYV